MEMTLNLILKSGIGLLALYLFYYALLRHETSFRFNRLYLLLTPLVALALPLVKWPALFAPDTVVAQTLQAIQLTEVTVVSYNQPKVSFPVLQALDTAHILGSLYLLVALFLVFKLVRQVGQIIRLRSEATTVMRTPDNVQVLQLQQSYASFAFLNYVFLSDQEQLSAREKQQVLAHELAHVRLGHTYDILFYELFSILLWFNPIVWLLKNELRNLHEYQADACVLAQHQPQEYGSLLTKKVLFNMGLPVGSHFLKPQVLQRLHMLKLHGRQPNWLKPLLSLPLLGVLVFSLTSQQVAADIATNLTSAPPENQPQEASVKPAQPAEVRSAELEPAGVGVATATPAPLPATPLAESSKSPTPPAPANEPTEDNTPQPPETKPYTYVEQMPQFEGGEQEMLKFLGMNTRYPKKAQEQGDEGLAVISFVVNTDGALSELAVLKPLTAELDTEALRVVQLMQGKWQPGMQNGRKVPVRYTLPIRFVMQ